MNRRYVFSLSAGLLASSCMGAIMPVPVARAQQASTAMTGAQATGGTAAPRQILLQQARFWLQQQQYDNARQALQNAQRIAPDAPDVLEVQGEYQTAMGNREAAADTLRHLQEVAPGSVAANSLSDLLHERSISTGDLSHVRSLAASGHSAEAVAGYQKLFNGGRPPHSLAIEYYQTMAGVPADWDQARAGLAGLVAANPQDYRAQLAFAQTLTYNTSTRMEGLARLKDLQGFRTQAPVEAAAAAQSYRQTLSWLPVTAETQPLMQQWLTAHPDDTALKEHMLHPPGGPPDKAGLARQAGFQQLNSGRLSAAEQSFQSALQINSHDADSLGGMGLVSMRQGDAAEARRYFQEAMAADPKTADRWRPALAGMEISGDYAAVRQLIAAHQYTEAKQRLTSLARQPGQFTGATLMLADLQRTTGQIDASEQEYRSVLARDPNNQLALMGLARVDMAQGNTAEARQLLSRVGPQYATEVGEIEVTGLMAAASHTSDSARKVAILREAMTQAPRDPWVRINLANALQQQGDVAEAGRVMQPILANPVTAQDRQAGILYTYGAGNDAATRRLLSGLSPEDYSPAIRSIAEEMQIKEDLASRLSMVPNPVPLIREALAPPDPTGARGVAVADLFRQRGDMIHARMALRIASTRTIDLSPDQRLAYATEYMKISNPVAAARLLAPLGDGSGSGAGNALLPEQQQTLQQLRMGIAVAQSDLLNQRGDQAQAYDHLAPALRADPEATSPKLALARLYNGEGKSSKALDIDLAVLRHNPQDLDARQAAVQAAVNSGRKSLATHLAMDGVQESPMDARAWLGMAVADQADGHGHRTIADLRRAYDLRLQQVEGSRSASGPAATEEDALAPPSSNPFRHHGYGRQTELGAPVTGGSYSMEATSPEAADQMLSSISGQINTLRENLAPSIDGGLGFRSRSGEHGMGRLTEANIPIVGRLPLQAGESSLTFSITPTMIWSGDLNAGSVYDVPRYGTNMATEAYNQYVNSLSQNNSSSSLRTQQIQGGQGEAGFAPDVQFSNSWVRADVGASPIGFPITNVLGGVEFSPRVGPVTFRVSAERRSITNSVLSYGGLRDPNYNSALGRYALNHYGSQLASQWGQEWGGVVTNHFHGQVEATLGNTILYGGGGYAIQTGKNTRSNNEREAGIGANTLVWHNANMLVRIGVSLTYFGYANNQDFYTYGQGGYFSPQSYYSATVPIRYAGQHKRLDWDVTGSVGYQVFHEHSSPFFPTSSLLQSGAQYIADSYMQNATASDYLSEETVDRAYYPGDSIASLTGGFNARVGYRFTHNLRLDLSGRWQKAGNWTESGAMISVHYLIMDQ
ncbi:cellulose synthase subunit BcsC-related outer membrane protein [Komagataeibacter oboediens]|uniref:Cellulose synthase 1 operon protein C n=2 Tax=Komagataeibacter xylinus TaxID=28448 RepID=BCSC3_KOMXY|nr:MULTISPECIES: cellulose synthase subunit BcsC-related outer membrane protein [Komagataeibacter]Q9WX63.1 RecName: Full=Cellulose synthase 1 operon protein C; Flags: Precursor [Komagataeibacter xylinus]MBV1824102.1 BCSC C-terminal domain-containing protein [Komagataeibacter oboediens]WEQ53464.1 cellulose synthase subunit BcsC-related outer membrane protein [Komagataeibacter oboediens]BAA77587.1 bcsCI [Komagataeibacter xylinus]